MKFHQPGLSSLSTLDLNANVNIGRRRRTGDDNELFRTSYRRAKNQSQVHIHNLENTFDDARILDFFLQ